MYICRLLVRSTQIISFLLITPLWAQTTTVSSAPVPQTLEEATAQRVRAAAMRNSADSAYATEQAACYKKILVNDCLAEAKKRHTQSMIDARNVDIPARDFQRDAKRSNAATREAKRDADRLVHDADQKEQAKRYRAEEAVKAADRERKIAAKAQKAEEGRHRSAAKQAKRNAKLEKRAKQDAELAAKKASVLPR